MPGTWNEVVRELGISSSPHGADAVEAGAYYMSKLRRAWKADRSQLERHDLGLASYNAGLGNVLKAQRFCGDARLWATVAECMQLVTGQKNANETKTYVTRIHQWWKQMELE